MTRDLLAQSDGLQLGGEPIKGAGPLGIITAGTDAPAVFEQQLSNIIGFITLLGGVFFVIFFLIAGFEWLQAGGDTGKAEKARSRMTNAAIGLLIMVLATALVGIVGGVFGIDVLNPAATFRRLIPGT
jgi:cytochrome bd-type quinol oxidase subunit 2